MPIPNTAEHGRLAEITNDVHGWRRWGPYVSDRQWGTVREDYSADGDAWGYLPHDLARSTAYRWGEDGLAAISDRYQLLCFGFAFWNGRDRILKERLFGLGNPEGNHGEDVKEYYFHVDNTPSHAYMAFLYKYPQEGFPYADLVRTNAARNGRGFEYELLDTGVFDGDRYFDIFIEYAKAAPDDIVARLTVTNRGPEAATLHALPHLWYRNSWSVDPAAGPPPRIRPVARGDGALDLRADPAALSQLVHTPEWYSLPSTVLTAPAGGTAIFTENETNPDPSRRPAYGPVGSSPYVKDAFHRYVIGGEASAVNPENVGSKAAVVYRLDVPPGGSVVLRFRLSEVAGATRDPPADVDAVVDRRKAEADEFYAAVGPPVASADEKRVFRRALAGLLWTKRSYLYDVHAWLDGDRENPPGPQREAIRNTRWRHLKSMRVMTLPDAWEYPWFAAWDLAFQTIPMALIDGKCAKDQLGLLLFDQFQHPNGQIPAFEWEFSDINPPVHAWAVWRVYNMDRIRSGVADKAFLARCFHKLMLNFTWWVNRVDAEGNNIFEGGFLGMDNVSPLDRARVRERGASLEQADTTGWMGMFCLNMMRIALELAKDNHVYEDLATKFFQHYVYVAAAMKGVNRRKDSLWDEEDGFFYDFLRERDGGVTKIGVRTMVGLVPLFAVERLELDWVAGFPEFTRCMNWFLRERADLVKGVVHTVEREGKTTHVLTILDAEQIRRTLHRMWDPAEFLSPHGIRSLSKVHLERPFRFDGQEVRYEPAETATKIMGGNSNWRGPVWFPMNFLLIESLRKLAKAFGSDFTVTTPGSGDRPITFPEMARDLADRLIAIWTRGSDGRRPVYGGTETFQRNPHWRDELLFFEYFHGDNGAGLGASHQTGWTALVASLIDEWRR